MNRATRINFFSSALIGVNVINIWELYLDFREWRSFFNDKLPPQFTDHVTEEEFKSSQAYSRDNGLFDICTSIKDIILTNIFMITKFSSKVYNWFGKSLPLTIGSFSHCWAYSTALGALSTLLEIPFKYYKNFVIEQKHGLNTMTHKEFVMDEIKVFLLQTFIAQPILTGLIVQIVRIFGEDFPLYFFIGASGVLMSFVYVFPTFIQPLFNTYKQIPEDSTLYKNISNLANEHKFPLKKVYEVDGSRRSNHSNAYFYGFWGNKRIVLFDTLIKQMKDDDNLILSVLCHELGHWKFNHSSLLLGIGVAHLFCISFGAKQVIFNQEMYKQFGFKDTNPFIGFELFTQIFVGPLNLLLGYALSILQRRLEFQADKYALDSGFGEPLRRALFVLHKENKSSLTPDPLVAALKYSHPPLSERVAAIDEEMKKSK